MHPRSRKHRSSTHQYQVLESRQLLAGITFDSGTGIITVEGTSGDDQVIVDLDSATLVSVELVGVDFQTFDLTAATQVTFDAFGGDDEFDNRTSLPSEVNAGAGDDTIQGGSGRDLVRGGSGRDTIRGGAGNDQLDGGTEDDQLFGEAGDDLLIGFDGDDFIQGGTGNDTAIGGAGADQIRGDQGLDQIYGNDGDDQLWGGDDADRIAGQAGDDRIYGDDGDDFLYGNDGLDVLVGLLGNDTLVGGNDDDILFGNEGNDFLYGNLGNDWISGDAGDDLIDGDHGEDRALGGAGNDRIWGGEDDDRLDGNGGDDLLLGETGADKLFGGTGADRLFGHEHDDLLNGGVGEDRLIGNEGNDLLFGDDDADRLFGSAGDDFLSGGAGPDGLFGNDGDDTLFGGDDDDFLMGHLGDDYIRGDAGDDTAYGGDGRDALIGNEDDDRLFGQNDDDFIRGDAGRDILVGAAGIDRLDGGLDDDDIYSSSEDIVSRDDDDTDEDEDHYRRVAGRPFGLSNRLTVSFAPDGTSIFDDASALFSSFTSTLSVQQIQDSVLDAFNMWATNGNLDVGLVADSGDPFGTAGKAFGDSRFGDVRVGAIPLPGDVNAIALGQGDFVAGTWAGDILFNSNAQFDDVEDFFAVALHEVGHVLGMEHTSDLQSVMHRYSNRTTLHQVNVDEFRSLYGTRSLDRHDDDDGISNNDSPEEATKLEFIDDDVIEGEIPAIAFGDISTGTDQDYFRVDIPGDYAGPVSFQITSETISQLAFRVSLLDATGQVLDQLQTSSSRGDTLSFEVSNVANARRFLRVESLDGQSVGSFGIAASLVDRSRFNQAEILGVLQERQYFNYDPEDLAEYLVDPENFLHNDDNHSDDVFANAVDLVTDDGFELNSRFEYRASLADATDVDIYRFETAENVPGATALNLSVRTMEPLGMTPALQLFDENGQPLETQIAVNGHGEMSIQLAGFEQGKEYYVAVATDSLLAFRDGNYELVVSYSSEPLNFDQLATGQLTGTTKQYHSLHVAESQMFQFAFEADALANGQQPILWATIYDEAGQAVYQTATRAGERRTANTTLLPPGSYTIEIEKANLNDVSVLNYQFLGIGVGDGQGPKFTDPSDSPFEQNGDGQYQFPDDVVSIDTFVVVDGISSNQSDPPADRPPTNLFLWYWGI